MKIILFVVISQFVVANSFSQMDNRFYFPNKGMDNLGILKYEKIALAMDLDTLTASVFYIHCAGGNVTKYVKFIEPNGISEAGE